MALTSIPGSSVGLKFGADSGGLAGLFVSLGGTTASAPSVSVPSATPVVPSLDPQIPANITYGKRMALFAGGLARIGGTIIFGPYFNDGKVTFGVSFGNVVPVTGTRVLFDICADSKRLWVSPAGSATSGGGTFDVEAFTWRFYQGTLTQSVDPLETAYFPGEEIAYRPQMVLFIQDLPYAQFIKPVPYISALIGDTTDGADPYDGINLGLALERIAHSPWAGYTSATYETVGITDVVPAVLFADNFNMIELGQSISRVYRNLDQVQSDKLRMKDRGSTVAPDITFDRDSILGGDEGVKFVRAEPSAQPREFEVITIDPGLDYMPAPSLSQRARNPVVVSSAVGKQTVTLPLVLDAPTRQAMTIFAHYYEENARKRVVFTVLIFGLEIEPGDLFRLTDLGADGISDEVFKCIETEHLGDYAVQITGEAILLCSLVASSFASASLGFHDASGTNSNYNFGVCNIGVAAADRQVIVVATSTKSISPYRPFTAVTIGGNAATIHASEVAGDGGISANPSMSMSIASLAVPSGTTATITVSLTGNVDGACIAVYALYGLVSVTPYDTASNGGVGANPSTTIDVPAGGIVIAGYGGMGGTPGSASWTGLNAVDQNQAFPGAGPAWSSGATQSGLAAQTGRTISVTAAASGPELIVAASFS